MCGRTTHMMYLPLYTEILYLYFNILRVLGTLTKDIRVIILQCMELFSVITKIKKNMIVIEEEKARFSLSNATMPNKYTF